jgi:hypothetical protein
MTGDEPSGRPLSTHRTTQAQEKHTQKSMPRLEFEPTISVSERAKVQALNLSATVIVATITQVTKI